MQDPLILAYHRVCPLEHPHADNALVVTADNFEKQLIYLKRKKYSFLTLEQYFSGFISKKNKARQKSCIVTFDDGYADNFLYAFPILQKYQIPAVFFITTGSVGRKEMFYWDYKNFAEFHADDRCMNWEELILLKRAGMEIASHTVNHYELTRLSKKQRMYELKHSKQVLDNKLNQNTISICYPRGKYRTGFIQELELTGYKAGVLTNASLFDNIEETNYTFNRVGIYNKDSGFRFIIKISKLFLFVKKILGAKDVI